MNGYTLLSVNELRKEVDDGNTIMWVGYGSDTAVLVRLSDGSAQSKRIYSVDISELASYTSQEVIQHVEATVPSSTSAGTSWQTNGWLRTLRLASMNGINISSKCLPGLQTKPTKVVDGCSMGYDIETSQKYTSNGSFPTFAAQILSIVLYCSCGYIKCITTIPHKDDMGIEYYRTSSMLVGASMRYIAEHMPQWLVGYNCFRYDNCCMVYHTPGQYEDSFRSITTGSKSHPSYSILIDLPGVNNVDLYSYLDKCMRHNYKNLSLGTVAEKHGAGSKLQMPTGETAETLTSLIYYNASDSAMTHKLWKLTKSMKQVTYLCVASCAPVVDCCRYVSGTMASCAVSSHAISTNRVVDWSVCDLRMPYEGGMVLEPQRVRHTDVTVVDFSSMYPTIIRDMGISPENIRLHKKCREVHSDRILDYDDKNVALCIKGMIVSYRLDTECVSRDVLNTTLSQRAVYKATDPDFAQAFKTLSNSLYGAFGFSSSPLYSPRAATTVTLMGRTAIALAEGVFIGLGLNVIYGDTDSCMLTRGRGTARYFGGNVDLHVTTALDIFHKIIGFTPIRSMRMSREAKYPAMLLVDKKHYAYVDTHGKIMTKGLSTARKDRIGICREMTSAAAELILKGGDQAVSRSTMCKLVDYCTNSIYGGTLDMYMVGKEVRFEGNTCYRITGSGGIVVNIPVARADLTSRVPYDRDQVYKSFESDMNRICIPAGYGSVRRMLAEADL